jgi:hypothetical protein
MRIYIALAVLATMLAGGIAFEAHAYTCTTSCFGNTCTTTCF